MQLEWKSQSATEEESARLSILRQVEVEGEVEELREDIGKLEVEEHSVVDLYFLDCMNVVWCARTSWRKKMCNVQSWTRRFHLYTTTN